MAGRFKQWDEVAAIHKDATEWFKRHRDTLRATISDTDERNTKALADTRAHFMDLLAANPGDDTSDGATPRTKPLPKSIDGLCDKSEFVGKDATMWTAVKWVGDVMCIRNITPSDAPSSLAWGLLQWINKSTANERDFITTMLSKLLPTKAQIDDSDNEQTDDQLDSDVDFFTAARGFAPLPQGSEGAARKRDVAGSGTERGAVGQGPAA